jgi:hypothetical protein
VLWVRRLLLEALCSTPVTSFTRPNGVRQVSGGRGPAHQLPVRAQTLKLLVANAYTPAPPPEDQPLRATTGLPCLVLGGVHDVGESPAVDQSSDISGLAISLLLYKVPRILSATGRETLLIL